MPNIAKILKDEIQRLARKEVNQAVAPLKQSNASLKKSIQEYKQRIAALEKERKKLAAYIGKNRGQTHDSVPKQGADGFQITGKQVRSLRGRLGISQMQLAKLIGVSGNIVTIWENKPGRLHIRKSEVREALADLKVKKKNEVIEQAEVNKRGRVKTAEVAKPVKKPGPKRESMTGKIIALVQKSPKGISVEAIIEKTNVSKQQAWNILSTAKKDGKISSAGRGMYGPA